MTYSLHVDTARTWRGGQNQVLLTVNGLRAIGHRATLVAHPDGELRRRVAEGLDLIPLAPRTEMDLAAAWKFSRLIKRLRPDVIHAHDPHGIAMASFALSIGGNSAGGPALVAARRVDFHLGGNSLSRWKNRQVDCFIAASEAIRQIIVADGVPAARTVTVHEGIDVERVAATDAVNVHEAFFLPHGAPVVGNVAALVPHKGQHYLIDAAAIAVRQVPDVRFVIVGDGELRHALEEHIRHKHLERHVFLAGFRDDALELTKGFDIFVMSSISEGMCTALVDAMAASKPSVTTDAGALPEVMVDGETGFLVPIRDHQAMAARIVQLLKNPKLRARMGEAALQRARDRFTVDRMVDGTQAVYESLFAAQRKVS